VESPNGVLHRGLIRENTVVKANVIFARRTVEVVE
jgi:hypothetical protein